MLLGERRQQCVRVACLAETCTYVTCKPLHLDDPPLTSATPYAPEDVLPKVQFRLPSAIFPVSNGLLCLVGARSSEFRYEFPVRDGVSILQGFRQTSDLLDDSTLKAFLKAFGRSCRNHPLVVYSRPFTDKDAVLAVFPFPSE